MGAGGGAGRWLQHGTQSLGFIGKMREKRQEAAMKGEGCLLQAAWYEGCGKKTAITWQDFTDDSVLRKATGSHETKKLRNCFRKGVEETADLVDDGLWVAEGKGFQKVGKEKRGYTEWYVDEKMRGSPDV